MLFCAWNHIDNIPSFLNSFNIIMLYNGHIKESFGETIEIDSHYIDCKHEFVVGRRNIDGCGGGVEDEFLRRSPVYDIHVNCLESSIHEQSCKYCNNDYGKYSARSSFVISVPAIAQKLRS